jgi:serine protease Do
MGRNVLKDLYLETEKSVSMVVCQDINSKGSGFLVSSDGYIVTNNHVVSEITLQQGVINNSYSQSIEVIVQGTRYEATLVNDPTDDHPVVYDYSILKAKGLNNTSYLELGELTSVQPGDSVLCLGFPLDFDNSVATDGIVSGSLAKSR